MIAIKLLGSPLRQLSVFLMLLSGVSGLITISVGERAPSWAYTWTSEEVCALVMWCKG